MDCTTDEILFDPYKQTKQQQQRNVGTKNPSKNHTAKVVETDTYHECQLRTLG